ncbi:MAG: hypothetical protein WDM96_11400 [Lacunisphaera sp.]
MRLVFPVFRAALLVLRVVREQARLELVEKRRAIAFVHRVEHAEAVGHHAADVGAVVDQRDVEAFARGAHGGGNAARGGAVDHDVGCCGGRQDGRNQEGREQDKQPRREGVG